MAFAVNRVKDYEKLDTILRQEEMVLGIGDWRLEIGDRYIGGGRLGSKVGDRWRSAGAITNYLRT